MQNTHQEWLEFGQEVLAEDDSPLIRNLLLCGNKSGNGYEIPATAFGSQAHLESLYEGQPVFLDHGKPNPLMRSIKDMAGVVRNPRMVNGKPYGDIDTEGCMAGPDLRRLVKARVPNVGLSQVAFYKMSGKTRVEQVTKVHSVDVVVRPATTKTFFERNEETMESEVLTKELETVRLERDTVKATVGTLTSENASLKASVLALEQEKSELAAKVDAYEAAVALEARRMEVRTAIGAAGLDIADPVVCSELFVESLIREPDVTTREKLIAERKQILAKAPVSPSSKERRSSEPEPFNATKVLEEVGTRLFTR